jgi:hypothetical protein
MVLEVKPGMGATRERAGMPMFSASLWLRVEPKA